MKLKNYFFAAVFLMPAYVLADEPVGVVISESNTQSVVTSEQTMEVNTVEGLEEVVVTAQKRVSTLQDTPIALTAVTESSIQDLDIKNVVDLAGISPNVLFVETPSNNTAATIAIRGAVTINPAATWEPTVGLYLDGVYLGKGQGSIFDVVDLERVEVLRGPQGTLYGRNTVGGAVNLISKKPTESGTSFKTTLGTYNLKQHQLVSNLKISNKVFAKLVLNSKERDGYVKNSAGPDASSGVIGSQPIQVGKLDTIDSKGYRFVLNFEGETSSLTLAVDETNQDNIPPLAQLGNTIPNWSTAFQVGEVAPGFFLWPLERFPSKGRLNVASVNENVFETSDVKGVSLTFTKDTRIGTLKAIISNREVEWSDNLDLDGSPFPIANTSRFSDLDQDTAELQLTGSMGQVNYVLGYYMLEDTAYTANPQSYFGGGQFIDQRYAASGDAKAIYGQIDFPLGSKTTITLGARSTDEDKTGYKEYVGLFSANASGDYSDTNSTIIISHDYSDSTNLYFKIAEGFKAGGFSAETPNPFSPGGLDYEPETVESMELGLKGRYLDNRLHVNAAYFENEHEDMQISYFTAQAAAASLVVNNSADISGFEFETRVYINDTTQFSLNYGHLDPEYTGSTTLPDGFTIEQFPYAPKDTLYASLEKDYGAFRMRLDHSRVGEHAIFPYSSLDPRADLTNVDSRGITDLRLFFGDDSNVQITAWIKNLSDKDYIQNNIPFGPGFGQLTLDYYGAPRTIGFDFTYNF